MLGVLEEHRREIDRLVAEQDAVATSRFLHGILMGGFGDEAARALEGVRG